MSKISVLSFRQLLNETQNLNAEHSQIIQTMWLFYVSTGQNNESLYEDLNSRCVKCNENHKMILAGQRYLNIVEAQADAKYSVC